MSSLETKYNEFKKLNPTSKITYERWLEIISGKLNLALNYSSSKDDDIYKGKTNIMSKEMRQHIDKIKNWGQSLNENIINVDRILDKINKYGQQNLTHDEITYLSQYNNNSIDKDLEKWLFDDEEDTFDSEDNKLLFDEFTDDENIFYNYEKLKRVITKHLNKKPFTNNADWGSGYVWNINGNSNFVGTFLYLGDDELVVLKRGLIGDEYDDQVIQDIKNSRELYSFLVKVHKV